MNENEQHIYHYYQVHLYSKNHILKRLVVFGINLRILVEVFNDDVTYSRKFDLLLSTIELFTITTIIATRFASVIFF